MQQAPPEEFLLQALSVGSHRLFTDPLFTVRGLVQAFELPEEDAASIAKVRCTTLSMAAGLCFRAGMEKFTETYGTADARDPGGVHLHEAAPLLFDGLLEAERTCASLPHYADETYLGRWRRRYEQAIVDSSSGLDFAVLETYFQQATFAFEQEPAVDYEEDMLAFLAEETFTHCRQKLRSLYGSHVLTK